MPAAATQPCHDMMTLLYSKALIVAHHTRRMNTPGCTLGAFRARMSLCISGELLRFRADDDTRHCAAQHRQVPPYYVMPG